MEMLCSSGIGWNRIRDYVKSISTFSTIKGKGFFGKDDVEPGMYVLISSAANIGIYRIGSKPGNVHFVRQVVGFPEAGKLARYVFPGKRPLEKVRGT